MAERRRFLLPREVAAGALAALALVGVKGAAQEAPVLAAATIERPMAPPEKVTFEPEISLPAGYEFEDDRYVAPNGRVIWLIKQANLDVSNKALAADKIKETIAKVTDIASQNPVIKAVLTRGEKSVEVSAILRLNDLREHYFVIVDPEVVEGTSDWELPDFMSEIKNAASSTTSETWAGIDAATSTLPRYRANPNTRFDDPRIDVNTFNLVKETCRNFLDADFSRIDDINKFKQMTPGRDLEEAKAAAVNHGVFPAYLHSLALAFAMKDANFSYGDYILEVSNEFIQNPTDFELPEVAYPRLPEAVWEKL